MEHIGKIMPQIAGHYQLKEACDSAQILHLLAQIIENYWGAKGVKNLKPQKVLFNQIFVKAANSAWAQELQLQKHHFLEELQQKKIKNISAIKVVLG